ncbi:MAG: hypothetical protein U1F76_00810 [Candidatus Competibacteraceae bacterium]
MADAQASLLGTQATVTNIFEGTITDGPTTVTVRPGAIELFPIAFGGEWYIDFESDSITFLYARDLTTSPLSSDDMYTITGLHDNSAFGRIVGFNLTLSGTIQPMDIDVTMPDSATLIFTNLANGPSGGVYTNGLTANGSSARINLIIQQIAEPSEFSLLALGLMMLGGQRFTRKSAWNRSRLIPDAIRP